MNPNVCPKCNHSNERSATQCAKCGLSFIVETKPDAADWERWAREVLTDFKLPYDNHTVGLRSAITTELANLRKQISDSKL